MRVDQLLMLGVVGLGAYALYRMSKTEKEIPIEKEKEIPKIPVDITTLPNLPGPIPQLPREIATVQGNPIQLTNSRAYFGRIETINPQGQSSFPFSVDANREQLIATLENLGFDGVRVYMTPEEARRAIGYQGAVATPGRGTRWFYGRWLSPSMSVPRPAPLVLLWITKGPPITGQLLAPGITPEKAKALGMCNFPYKWVNQQDYYNNCIAGEIFDPEMTQRFQYVMKD